MVELLEQAALEWTGEGDSDAAEAAVQRLTARAFASSEVRKEAMKLQKKADKGVEPEPTPAAGDYGDYDVGGDYGDYGAKPRAKHRASTEKSTRRRAKAREEEADWLDRPDPPDPPDPPLG